MRDGFDIDDSGNVQAVSHVARFARRELLVGIASLAAIALLELAPYERQTAQK